MVRPKYFSFNEMCQNVICTMHTNFHGLKMHLISEPKKSSCCNSASKQRRSLCEISNKTYRLWNLYEITPSDTKALGFSTLSIQIGYILLKHPVLVQKLTSSDRNFPRLTFVWNVSFCDGY